MADSGYQVALENVIDAFGMYAIDACLLNELPTVFNPKVVSCLKDDEVAKIAGESLETISIRENAEKKLSTLERSLTTLQSLKHFKMQRTLFCFHDMPHSFILSRIKGAD